MPVEQLLLKTRVPLLPEPHESCLQLLSLLPRLHKVGGHDGGAPGDAVVAVDEDGASSASAWVAVARASAPAAVDGGRLDSLRLA